ncbi:MAG: hypothetical protein ACTH29_03080 [Fusobacterium sp.]
MKKYLFMIALVTTMLGLNEVSEAKTTRVTTGFGKVKIKEGYGTDYIRIKTNSGLIIEADWESESNISGFGYDLIDVRVSEDYNKMAIYMVIRSHIVAYLNGEYDY